MNCPLHCSWSQKAGNLGKLPEAGNSCERLVVLRRTSKSLLNSASAPLCCNPRPPVTRVLNGETSGSALGSAPGGALGNRGALGGAPESANWEIGDASGSACKGGRPQFALSGANPRAFRFPRAPAGALPRALPEVFSIEHHYVANIYQCFLCPW